MKLCVVMLVMVVYANADCGCLKCSRHLQGVDIPGPAGFPVKVIFRRPKPSGCGCSCGCEAPSKPPPKKITESFSIGTPGGRYSATVQLPLTRLPKPRVPLKNLKYRTDTILVPSPPTEGPITSPSVVNPSALTTADILNWLRNLQLAHQLAAQQQPQPQPLPPPTGPTIVPQLTVETVPCECEHCRGGPILEPRSLSTDTDMPQCPHCQRSRRSVTFQEDPLGDQHTHRSPSSEHSERSKRDLGKRGYNFFMNMLPQFVRAPLHHSVQGSQYVRQSKPKPNLKQKINELVAKKTTTTRTNPNNQQKPQDQYFSPQRLKLFNQKSNSFQPPKASTHSFLHQYSDYGVQAPLYLDGLTGRSKDSPLEKTTTFRGTKISPKLPLSNREAPTKQQIYATLNKSPRSFETAKASTNILGSPSSNFADPSLDNTHKLFLQKYGSQRSASGTPKLTQRLDEKNGADEKNLLKKLKRLNNNPYSSNLEDQATSFMQKVLKPEELKRRNRRSSKDRLEINSSRKKRTIILGSDEIDLPTHYEVEMVSVEDDSEENKYEEVGSYEGFEEEEDDDPVLGVSPFRRNVAAPRRFYPSLPSLQPKPEIVLGKNVIQKAVREELEAHHRKLEKEQKIKEMKENLKKKKQRSFDVPQNPIFALLTAPVKFLKHFSDLNKGGVNPIMSTLPKLVYTTKKVFKDLGKNFQRNCLDLASNVIGDFDHVHPTIIDQMIQPDGRRYRRHVLEAELRKCVEENQNKRPDKENLEERNVNSKNETPNETNDLKLGSLVSSRIKLEKPEQTGNIEFFLIPGVQTNKSNREKGSKKSSTNTKNITKSDIVMSDTEQNAEDKFNLTPSTEGTKNNKKILNDTPETTENSLDNIPKLDHFSPDYTLAFENSKESTNFRQVPEGHVRKKRYVVRVVNDDEIQGQVEDYLQQKLGDQYEYHDPLQGYYDKVNGFLSNLYSSHQPLCKIGDECYYHRPATVEEPEEAYDDQLSLESMEDSFEERPRKKKIQIRKMKPKVIIDNKGRPFMEYNGYKRPLKLQGKKFGMLRKVVPKSDDSSEETGNKIATLIARAKVDSEVVGNSHKDIIPHQIVKQRISFLLKEIDQLVHLDAENYDEIFEDLIKIEHIKTSIEQDWKRLLIDDKVNDIKAKIGLFSKIKELQHVKNSSLKKIAAELKKNDNEFVRCQLVNSLIRLQKLQSLISSIVEDFEQHLKTRTSFNTKREIKYVDYLSDLKFAFAKTRNDLIKMLCKDRDSEGLKKMEMLHKLKKLLSSSDDDPEKFEHAAQLLWEMKNLQKLQKETISDMNKKLARNFKVKKELKILFDLQRRFEDCNKELGEFLGPLEAKGKSYNIGQKKDIKEVIADVKRRHEEMLQKTKERSNSLLRKS